MSSTRLTDSPRDTSEPRLDAECVVCGEPATWTSPVGVAACQECRDENPPITAEEYRYKTVLAHLPPTKDYKLTDPLLIQPRAIEWLWKQRIATGTLTVMAGPGGVGKGALWIDLAAQATCGSLDGDLTEPVSVLILTAEEGLADVIVPRLKAANADLERVRILTIPEADYDRNVTLPDDLLELRQAVSETGARLVVLDPLNAHLSDRIDSHKDAPLRRALSPLSRLASETSAAVLGIAHTNKGQGDAVNRVLGSVGYVNAARSVLIVGRPPDSDDGSDRIVAVPKANNTITVPSLRFRLESRQVKGYLASGGSGEFEIVGVKWLGEDPAQADDLFGSREDRSALAEASDFLTEQLAHGPRPKSNVMQAARADSIADRTLHRARRSLKVVVERDTSARGRPSTWRLPDDYVPRGYVPNPLAHNKIAQPQGLHTESDDYVPTLDVGTKPPERPSDDDPRNALPEPAGVSQDKAKKTEAALNNLHDAGLVDYNDVAERTHPLDPMDTPDPTDTR